MDMTGIMHTVGQNKKFRGKLPEAQTLTTRIPYLGQDKFLKSLEVGNGLSNSKQ